MTKKRILNKKTMNKKTKNFCTFTLTVFLFIVLIPHIVSANDSISYADYVAKQACFNSSEGPIRYRDEGKGQVIVMVHGVASSGWLYRSLIEVYTAQGFRVIVPDMLGFGESDCPEGALIYDPQHHANRLLQLLQALSVTQCSFLTQAEGSLWIAPILRNHPEMVEKTVLINPLLNASGLTNKNQLTIGLLATLGVFNMNWRATSYVQNYVKSGEAIANLSEGIIKGYTAGIDANKYAGIIGHFEYLTSRDFLNQFHYPSIENPLLMIVGASATSINWEKQYAALNWPPSSTKDTVDKIENGSELLTEELPVLISKKIINFIGDR